jgi:hypothetical protein
MTAHDDLAAHIKEEFRRRGKEISDGESSEAARNLVGYFDILYRIALRIKKLDRRLKTEPDGFPVEGACSCLACGRSIDATNGWYHKGGQRCLICHKAVMEGIVPLFVLRNHDSYYRMWKLKDFGVEAPAARKMVKDGTLKARVILKETGRAHEYIFLKKENPTLQVCERFNPIWKSQKRHQYKWAVRREYARKNSSRT